MGEIKKHIINKKCKKLPIKPGTEIWKDTTNKNLRNR